MQLCWHPKLQFREKVSVPFGKLCGCFHLAADIIFRYNGLTMEVLPLEEYADGKWYNMNEEERKKSHPLIVNNNWVMGMYEF